MTIQNMKSTKMTAIGTTFSLCTAHIDRSAHNAMPDSQNPPSDNYGVQSVTEFSRSEARPIPRDPSRKHDSESAGYFQTRLDETSSIPGQANWPARHRGEHSPMRHTVTASGYVEAQTLKTWIPSRASPRCRSPCARGGRQIE